MKQCWAGGLFVLALFALPASSAAAQGQQSSRDNRTGSELKQNYPNPFNSTTTIPFHLALNGRTILELYSIDGRRVGVLLDEELPRGVHQTELRNMALASGIYLYRIRVTNHSGQPLFMETKKMLLVK